MNTKKFLDFIHRLHYLQYPFLILGLGYSFKRHVIGTADKWGDLNLCLLFMGIALSFTGLADVSKAKGISKRVMSNPKSGKLYVLYLLVCFAVLFGLGIYSFFQNEISVLKDLSVGMLVLSIGIISLIKMSLEAIRYFGEK